MQKNIYGLREKMYSLDGFIGNKFEICRHFNINYSEVQNMSLKEKKPFIYCLKEIKSKKDGKR